ncbi:MAG TPA: DUF6082 family protein [Spirillospora sp.]|nr:DUF6082 family protein [Spirillospora sp.]
MAAGAAVGAVLVLIGLSPFVLKAAFRGSEVDWATLSDIGQTYGGVSALLSAGGLVAVGVSLSLQAREQRHAREQAARGTQFELMRIMLDDPAYLETLGERTRGGLTADELRRDIYLNLLLNWWQMRWEFGDMTEYEVRSMARADIFSGAPGRDYWRRNGEQRLLYAATKQGRSFNRLLAEECHKAVAENETAPDERRGRPVPLSPRLRAAVLLTVLGGGAAATVLHRFLMSRALRGRK